MVSITRTLNNPLDSFPAEQPLARTQVDRVELVRAAQLNPSMLASWRQIQTNNPSLQSPYFCPEFFQAASSVRPDAELAVLFSQGELVGFFPFHRLPGDRGLPIGGAVNDYHGIIGPSQMECDPLWLIRQCRLQRWDFHSLWWPQHSFTNHTFREQIPASYAALGNEPQSYLQALRQRSTTIARQPQKTRKMQRELGELQFEPEARDPESLLWVIAQKREKYRRTGCTDFFAPAWTRDLLHQIHGTKNDYFRGLCSVLRAGGRIVAAHFGMQHRGILHYWYPVFDRAVHHYSPGTELYLRLVESSPQLAITQIEMGYGSEIFKSKIVTHWNHLASGSIDSHRLRFILNRTAARTVERIKQSPLRQTIKNVGRWLIPDLGKPRVE